MELFGGLFVGGLAVGTAVAVLGMVMAFRYTTGLSTTVLSIAYLTLLAILLFGARALRSRTRRLAIEEGRHTALIERIPAVTFIDKFSDDDPDTAIPVYISPQVEPMFGYSREEWMTDVALWESLIHPEDRDEVLRDAADSDLRGSKTWGKEYRMVRKDGSVAWVREDTHQLREEHANMTYWQGVITDTTERKEAEQQVAYLAFHDKLTGLGNRHLFEQELERAMARARRTLDGVGVIYIDLDDFKSVNDSLGHSAGDELLCRIAERLLTVARETDLVTRQGGDEFLLLVPDLSPEHGGPLAVVSAIAARIRASFVDPFEIAGTLQKASASVGVSLYPTDAEGGEDLLRHADTAMYQSKKEGPGGYRVFSDAEAV
jgi:diguanylate cyclase (GGDEF)-like protein/PAS domain S-box-containing protein